MNDALLVGCRERLRHLARVLDGPARRQRATRQAVTQRIAVQQFGDSEGDAVLRADVVNPDDVRVRERGQRLRLPLEPREPLRIGGDHVREDFQCDLTLQPRVARPKDFAHASGPQRADDFVGTKAGTRGKGHRARDYSPGGVAGLKGVVLRLETVPLRCEAAGNAVPFPGPAGAEATRLELSPDRRVTSLRPAAPGQV